MKTDVVLDTSILVKIFLQESDSHLAVNLLDKLEAASAKIYCPNFAKIEFVSTLSKKLKWGLLDKTDLRNIVATFRKSAFSYVKEDLKLLMGAVEMAGRLQETTIYDCVFLALAEKLNGTYITADSLFYKKSLKTLRLY